MPLAVTGVAVRDASTVDPVGQADAFLTVPPPRLTSGLVPGPAVIDRITATVTNNLYARGVMPPPVVVGNGVAGITSGSQVNATNTGIAGAGISRASLTATAGATYATAGQTVTGKLFTDTVTINANNVTLSGCQFEIGGGSSNIALINNGNNTTVVDTTFTTTSGSIYMCIHHNNGTGLLVQRVDASGAENIITCESDAMTVDSTYLHGTSLASNLSGHADVIEIYGGSGHVIKTSKLAQTAGLGDAPINIAPYYQATIVDGVTIQDSYFSGGNSHILVDLQSTGYIHNVKVLRCQMDGHTDNGRYNAFQNNDGRAIVGTAAAQTTDPNAVLWPTSGADASHWVDCADLTPNNTGVIILP